MSKPWILGYCATHNGAVCLLHGDTIVAAVQEERLTGIKRERIRRVEDSLALNYCLNAAGITIQDLDMIVGAYFSGDPVSGPGIAGDNWQGQYLTMPHHLAHAVGAFALSGFDEATALVIDGQGGLADALPASERQHTLRAEAPLIRRYAEIMSTYRFDDAGVTCLEKHIGEWMPDFASLRRGQPMQSFGSLGGMYSSASHQIFGEAMDAGKVMGLAAFGQPTIDPNDFFEIADDGHFVFKPDVPQRYAGVPHWPDGAVANKDLAASVQVALEGGIHHLVERARSLGDSHNLCYAGGVALNVVTNEQIIQRRYFDDVYIMAAAEDSGTAIGAAYYGLMQLGEFRPTTRAVTDSVGVCYAADRIHSAVVSTPHIESVATDDVVGTVAELLSDGQIVGWFDGGSELGPRALGQRSILSDPRSVEAKTRLNARVKHREAFRPFAPLIIEEEAGNWFELPAVAATSELMLRTFPFKRDVLEQVGAVVHEDGTGRLQTLRADANPRLYAVLQGFFARTGVPIIVNTSFNVMGEPIVETPEDALWCLLHTDLDYVCLGETLVRRSSAFTAFLDLRPKATSLGNRQEVSTEWGRYSPAIPDVVRPILQLADGSRTGRAILQVIRSQTGFDEAFFQGVLRHLRRAGLLTFAA
ncbi:MAG: carbamoyltransferase C-terminal domain-containing protein [Pseudomonadota bacterium]